MLFANISADKIQFIIDGKETLVEHGDLEKSIADFMYAQKAIPSVFIINGPGSFTNLRICSLAFNMYNFLHGGQADYYSLDKLSLYKKLYQQNILPRHGYIYIGQKKNRRKVDLDTMEHEVVQEMNDETVFVDQVFEGEERENSVQFAWKNDTLIVHYQ